MDYEINLVVGLSNLKNKNRSALYELMTKCWHIKPVIYAHTDALVFLKVGHGQNDLKAIALHTLCCLSSFHVLLVS